MGTGKVAVVGAGSAFFGPAVVAGFARHPALGGLEVALHDIDAAAAARVGRFADAVAAASPNGLKVSAGTELASALEGADVVVVSVAVDREATWREDRRIGLEHGINHYAENGGPAAIFHAGRNLGLVLPIAREMEKRCPDAVLVNYTNPVARICTAVARYTNVRPLGVCHQLWFGYFMLGAILGEDLGIDRPADCRFRWTDEKTGLEADLSSRAAARVSIRAAGINHFTWALDIRNRETGQDLYPLLRERNATYDPDFEPLTRRVFRLFDTFPVPGDCHLVEYLPYTHEVARRTWERYAIQMYDFAWSEAKRRQHLQLLETVARTGDAAPALALESERVEHVVAALLGLQPHDDGALNLPNAGAIPNLPDGAIVEAAATVDAAGARHIPAAPLPPSIAELCSRQVRINELGVAGVVEGDRQMLREALAIDPMVTDPELPDRLLDAYLRSSERYLAPFFS